MTSMIRRLLAAVVVLLAAAWPAAAEQKATLNGVALVIGQSKYEHIPPLPNPANDARDILSLLSDLGFDARSASDRDARKLRRDLERFVEDAAEADVAFLYYSGHGIESGGENWLVPIDADPGALDNASETLVALSSVMDELKAIVPVAIVLLDACRTNPFPQGALIRKTPADAGTPIAPGGLTPTRGAAPLVDSKPAADNLGSIIGFAAEPGRAALDGEPGENSPYAAALLRHLGAMDGDEFGAVMRMVTEEVYLDTGTRQRPWVNESLRRFLYFGGAAPAIDGDDALITGERRKLLLTISALPEASRAEVQVAAARQQVPLDSLFGVLRALGTAIPQDPADLEALLDAQADRLKKMIAEREALRTDDAEVERLSRAADRAIREGALDTARKFLDDAVARIEQAAPAVDDAEARVRQKRLADAALYAKRADAAALAFDYRAAAADYGKAFALVEKWDETLRWDYKSMEAEALMAAGDAVGDRALLEQALAAFAAVADFTPRSKLREWAIARNDMAVVHQAMGEGEAGTANLDEAIKLFRKSLVIFEREKDDTNWAAAQNNIGNSLIVLGERASDPSRLREAVAAFRASLTKRDRTADPLGWAMSQNNLGIASFKLGERAGEVSAMEEAERAYRLALEEYTREKAPLQWAMVQNNLGNTLDGLATARGDTALYQQAAAAFRASIEVRSKQNFPLLYAGSQHNLGNVLQNIGKLESGTAGLEQSLAAYTEALTVFTLEKTPLDWAAAQHNSAAVMQVLFQRTFDVSRLDASEAAAKAALKVYTRDLLPLDWAMTHLTLGNAYMLQSTIQGDERKKLAVEAFRAALEVYTKAETPQAWALVQKNLGNALQSLGFTDPTLTMFRDAIAANRAALEVLTQDNAPLDWASVQNGLGTCLLNLSNFEKKPEYLTEATAAFQQAERVFTRERLPLQWAMTVNNMGDVHWALASRGGGKPEYQRAMERYEEAKLGFTEGGMLLSIPLLDEKIGLMKQQLDKQ